MKKSIRENIEIREDNNISIYGTKSRDTKGRILVENKCDFRTEFQRDRDRIIHSKSFRKLKDKTQVFIAKDDFFRTRLTHALEVSQVSRTIARALNLNEDLVEAISLGHDLGHTCFGHSGEEVLNKIIGNFKHNHQSLRVVEKLENKRKGLNLTFEVRDGILNHTGNKMCETLEGNIVKISDTITYLCHDIQDSINVGVLSLDDIPKNIIDFLGVNHSQRVNTFVMDIILETEKHIQNKNIEKSKKVLAIQSEKAYNVMMDLRNYMFNHVYKGNFCRKEREKAEYIITFLFEYYKKNIQELPDKYLDIVKEEGVLRGITDFIAGCTDQYAINLFKEKFIPSP